MTRPGSPHRPVAKTAGGIIIPDNAKEKPQEGEIVAVGSGARDEAGKLVPLDVKPATACCSANGRHRGQARGRRIHDHEGIRHPRILPRPNWPRRPPKQFPGDKPWLPRTLDFPSDARTRMLRGVEILNDAVRVTLGPKGRNVCSTNPTVRRASPRTA